MTFSQRAEQLIGFSTLWLLSWGVAAWADLLDDDDDDYDPLPGRTQEQIEALTFNFDEVVETIALYTALIALLVIMLAMAVSMRLWRWGAYVSLTLVSLIWFAFVEQSVTELYWIGADISLSTLIVLGTGLASLHFLITASFLRKRSTLASVRLGVLLLAVLPWGLLPFVLPMDGPEIPIVFTLMALTACLSHVLTFASYAPTLSERYYSKRNLVAVLVVLLLTGLGIVGELDEEFDVSFSLRTGFLAIVALFAFFLVQYVLLVLRERDTAAKAALAAAQRETAQASALLEAEKRYTRAREAAQMHTRRLATASHDIRQPIASLRATMASVASGQGAEIQSQLTSAFDYLDGLAKSYMETEDAENAPDSQTAARDDGREALSAQMLCQTLERMFRREAEEKKLSFEVVVEDAQVLVAPLVVTRILSNLMSNAIKHTGTGQIRLTAAPDDGSYRFTVQNSAALSLDQADRLFVHGEKGDASNGAGFGLAIIKRLAETHALTLTWSSSKAEGTEFRLGVPVLETV
ncbi:MAG: HAMP domain-containing sensor histidine kinase [Pseudomonadota bacterium]